MTTMRLSIGAAVTAMLLATPIDAKSNLADAQIVAAIIKESRDAYYVTGHPCACPEDHARNGSRCGGRSAYSRPGGAEPKCYAKDVTQAEIEAWRERH